MTRFGTAATAALAALAALVASAVPAATDADADAALLATARAVFGTVPAPDPAAVAAPIARLGRALFWDARIASDGRTSCAGCHAVADGSADRRPLSPDARGRLTARNSQPVYNSTLQPSLRWTGDRADAAAQAIGSLTGSMGFATLDAALHHLAAAGYAPRFAAVFAGEPQPLTARNFGRAIEAYERTLTTPAPFDRYLQGDATALGPQQRRGLQHFVARGCAGCHGGALLGGNSFQKFGVLRDYWLETGSAKIDAGRYQSTGDPTDRYVFRVPMLRNIAATAPYFHDGSVADLAMAVRVMARVQLGAEFDAAEVGDIVAFLHSLGGDAPVHYSAPQE